MRSCQIVDIKTVEVKCYTLYFRATIPEDEQIEIYSEVIPVLNKYNHHKTIIKRKVEFVPPTKTA